MPAASLSTLATPQPITVPRWTRHSQSQFHVGHATANHSSRLVTPQPITVPRWSRHSQSQFPFHAAAVIRRKTESLCQFSREAMAAQAMKLWQRSKPSKVDRPELSQCFEYQGVPMPDQTRRAVLANLTSLHGIFADPAGDFARSQTSRAC